MLPHLATRLYGTPLLIARPKLDVILAVLGSRIGFPERPLAVAQPKERAHAEGPPGIAVIPIHGTLVHRTMGLEVSSGLTSYTEIAQQLAAALENPKVTGILLDVDSPGGEAAGVFELAERIRTVSALKPVWAHANDSAFSAAYALAAGALRLTLSRTAGVGSIGVIALHVDQSVRDAKDGLSYTALYAGHHKNDFNPHAPLTPEAAGTLQREVDRLYGIFVHDVAALRGQPEETIRATEAAVYFGQDAVSAGLADAVLNVDAVLSEFALALSARPHRVILPARKPSAFTPLPTPTLNSESPMNEDESAREAPIESAGELDQNGSHEMMPGDASVAPESPAATSSAEDEPVPPAAAPPAASPDAERGSAEDVLKAAVAQARADALAIAELCQLAGQPERIVGFLAESTSPAQVRHTLLAQRAEQTEIASRITPDAGTSLRPEQSPVVAAVRKLHSKET